MSKRLKTKEEVREEFRLAGISIAEWARANGFERDTVVMVLSGRNKGLRGEAHRAAVALGLKVGRVVHVSEFMPAVRATRQRRAA